MQHIWLKIDDECSILKWSAWLEGKRGVEFSIVKFGNDPSTKKHNLVSFFLIHSRGGSRISGKGVHIYKGVGRFADFISFLFNIP